MYLKFSMEAFEIYECLFSQRNAHEQFFGVFVPTVIFSCNFLVFFVRENFKTYFIVYGKYNVKKNYVLENCSAQKITPQKSALWKTSHQKKFHWENGPQGKLASRVLGNYPIRFIWNVVSWYSIQTWCNENAMQYKLSF